MANTNTEIIAMLETNPSQAIRGVLDTLYLYNPAPVNELIEQLNEALKKVGFEAIVLDSLPETGKSGTIYFVPSGGETPNVYNEYVWVAETEKFEMVGSAQVDLSNYYTKDEIDDQLIDIVGYVGDETRPLRNDLNQLNKNIIKVADWVNAKDEEGNRAVLETEAQDAFRAINELNAKIGSGGGVSGDYLPLSGGTLTGQLQVEGISPSTFDSAPVLTLVSKSDDGETYGSYTLGVTAEGFSFDGGVMLNVASIIPKTNNVSGLGNYGKGFAFVHTKKLYNGANLLVPTEGGTLARLEDLNDITTVTIKEYD